MVRLPRELKRSQPNRTRRPDPVHVFAIIVNWNGGQENLECLTSLEREGFAPDEIVFVDNGSRDGSVDLVMKQHPGLRFVLNANNEGFGEGSNAGAKEALDAGAEALFFVNNDVVLEPGCMALLKAELDTGAGMTGPRVLFKEEPNRIWAAGGALTWRQNVSTLVGNGELDSEAHGASREVDYVPGCALLITRAAFEACEGFDARYFAYMEDVDLGLRGKALGARSTLCGEARVLHGASKATGGGYSARRKYMNGLNSVHFLRRHGDVGKWLRFAAFDVATLPPLFLVELLRGNGRAVLAKGLGILHGLQGRRVRAEQLETDASRLW